MGAADREPPTRSDPFARLDRALSLFTSWQDGKIAASPEELLTRHADLRDLLEPLLRAAPAADEEAGKRLGEFRIVREIGRGGMGIVYEAEQGSLDRRVALKVLPPHPGLPPRAIARFKREATVCGKLRHRGLVEVYSVGDAGDTHYFAMELVRGAPLDKVLDALREGQDEERGGRAFGAAVQAHCLRASCDPEPCTAELPPFWHRGATEVVAALAIQVADALHHAHEAGVVHRDVKPSNVLVLPEGRAVLTDFGLSLDEALPNLSLDGTMTGTPGYISPEQVEGDREVIDRRTDVFSLGVTLYEMLTLHRPYDQGSTRDEMRRIVRAEPPRPESLNPRLPRDLSAVVLKCLEKEPARRYQTAAALAADLAAFLAYQPVRARHVTAVGRLLRWVRRERLKASLVGVLAVSLPAVLGTWYYLERSLPYIALGQATERGARIEQLLGLGFRQILGGSDMLRAVEHFAAVLRLDPGNAAAAAGQILARIRTGNPDDARRELQRARARWPDAVVLDRLDRYLQAAAAQQLFASDWSAGLPEPKDALDCFFAGLFEYERGVYGHDPAARRRAFRLLDRACLLSPTRQRFLLCARAETVGWLGDPDAARDAARVLLELWPDEPDALYARAVALADVEPAAAIALFERLRPDDETGFSDRLLGELLMVQGQHAAAEACCRAALRRRPENADFLGALGRALVGQGRFAAALPPTQDAAARVPGRPDLQFNLGVVLRNLGRDREAIAAFETAARLAPHDHLAPNEVSHLCAKLGDLQAAIAARRVALQRHPTSAEYRNDLAVHLGQAGRHAEAIEIFQGLLRETRPERETLHNYGVCLVEAGRAEEGYAQLRRCIELYPDYRPAYTALAACLMRAGRVLEATKLLGEAAGLRGK